MCPQPVETTATEMEGKNASTGPRTPEGKAISSRNALKHGLASETMIIASESAAEWEEFRDGMFAEWQPTTPTEEALVGDMAKHQWLKDRAIRLQNEKMGYFGLEEKDLKHFSVLMRYQVVNERAFARAKKQIADLRKETMRKDRQPEFVSQNENAPAEQPPLATSKRRKRDIVAQVNAMSDAEAESEVDEMILAFALGPVPSRIAPEPAS